MDASSLILLCCLSLVAPITLATDHNNKNCKTMATFNIGLMNSVPGAEERRPHILEALKNSHDDFICLQEVWFEQDMIAILETVASQFPHHWSKLHAAKDYLREPVDAAKELKDTPCSMSDATRLSLDLYECGFNKGCYNLTGIEQSLCLLLKCGELFQCAAIKEACIVCIVLKGPQPFEDSIAECVLPSKYHNRMNEPGLMILSKKRLNRVSYHEYFPGYRALGERGFIQAELDDGKLVGCTHLTSVFYPYLEYELPFSSYLEQQTEEIGKLGNAFAGKKHILMGDFNTGPVVKNKTGERNLTGEYTFNYDKLLSFGYRAPYMEQDGRCTFCKDNPVALQSPNNVIDQVLIAPPNAFTTPLAERAFDSDPPLSDHYGARVKVCDP